VSTVIDQRLDSTAQTDILNGSLAMMRYMSTRGWIPSIYHRVPRNSGEFGTTDQIFTIDVGDVFDNQRRRRNQLVETRVSATI
jgi:hypothetical protein